jgi:superfamily II RNA helicase
MSAPLAPTPGGPSDALDRFLDYVSKQGLTLYPAQEEAILEIFESGEAGRHVVLSTPTGSGKSLVALALHHRALADGQISYYTAPIKALVSEKFFALCETFGPESVGMLTGDASINRNAPVICCTAEILGNLCLREAQPRVDAVVMDEFHYYSDRERGVAWQIPLLLLPRARFLLMSATLGDTGRIEEAIEDVTGRGVARIQSGDRPVPLDYEYRETPLHETLQELMEAKKAPIYLVNFTQRAAAEQAQNLMSVNFSTREEKEAIRAALQGFRFDTPYGRDFQRFVRHGLGLHHAGLLPKYRLLVEKLSQQGLLKVVSGTDTLGVGVNIPLRTVAFTQLCKYDGEKTAILSARDFHQIAGRAGRKGFDEQGSVVAQAPDHVVENKRLQAKAAGGKKVTMQKPPQKGYVHWDKPTFERLIAKQPEPLESRFQVTHGMLIHLLQSRAPERGRGYGRLVRLIRSCHEGDRQKLQHLRNARALFRSLRHAGIVELTLDESARSPYPVVREGLQPDFSLNHTLSLFLMEAIPALDRQSPTYALEVLSLVESILEDPDVVLYKQVDKAKTERIAELKAQGVEYDQRMAELEKVEHPKPMAELTYGMFAAFAELHPWVGEANVRPKSVIREMVERYLGFDDYVREYGLQRSEGVLLRYVSGAYKALVQSVPETARDEALVEIIAGFKAMIRAVDSSLIDEWERLREPGAGPAPAKVVPGLAMPGPPDILADRRAFTARVRLELHRLVKTLAERRNDEAAELLHPSGDWTTARVSQAMSPFWAEHQALDTTPRTRRPEHTFLEEIGPRRFRARQKLMAPGEEPADALWMLECEVDLGEPRPEDAPLLTLVRVGT